MSWCKRLGERVNKCFEKILFHAKQLPLKQKKNCLFICFGAVTVADIGSSVVQIDTNEIDHN